MRLASSKFDDYRSWAGNPKSTPGQVKAPVWRCDPVIMPKPCIPYGMGRSYGDCCLINEGTLIDTRRLDHLIEFRKDEGILRCESGLTLDQILQKTVPKGWIFPVLPGTSQITVGGAVANDIHGKNHHRAGVLGCHVRSLCLLRSDGSRQVVSPRQNRKLFQATIGGIGLTGLILWVEVQLAPLASASLDVERICFESLSQFFSLTSESDESHEFNVAWMDSSLTAGKVRGVLLRADYCASAQRESKKLRFGPRFDVPSGFPSGLLNRLTIGLFNTAYFNAHRLASSHPETPFFQGLIQFGSVL